MEKLQPKLRFAEFEGNWESTEFKDLVKINQGLQIPISERYLTKIEGSHFYITNEFLKYGSEKQYFIKNPTESVLCDENDILMTRTGNTGLVVTNVKGAFHNNFFKINYPSSIEKNFLFYFLNLDKTQNLIKSLAGTSTIPDLNHTDFYKIQFVYPKKQEQTKIATFLSSVDEKLNLLKEKKALLEEYKKGMMQKIFSQEIRFKDEHGKDFADWEEKSLGEIGEFQTSSIDKLTKPNEKEVFLINYMNVYRHENINNETVKTFQVVTAKDSQIESCNLVKGDILFTPSSETPDDIGHSVVIFEDLDSCVYSYHLMRFRPKIKIDILYSHYFCNNSKVLNQLAKLSTGSTRFTISVKSFSSVKVDLPCLDEQTKIANFLSAIDEKIELATQQIEDTQEYKKGLLQQMFC
ncbi:MAG: restriction endonuclease subunit S [Flavobacteriia bacterium]|nr:restriction endonuclease subunit S [Flavobacteriia bacterium]